MSSSAQNSKEYNSRLAAEDKAFRDRAVVHNVPDIFHYWSNKYVLPKLHDGGFPTLKALFTDTLSNLCSRTQGGAARFLSIGSGNCDLELNIAAELHSKGHSNFVIDCLDLNEAMLERGRASALVRGLSNQIHTVRADFNQWQPSLEYDGAIANQALHHVVNLEGLLAGVEEALRPNGRFIIADMVGRNGHLRWPEALAIIYEFWRRLPPSYRYNHELKRYEELYEDWDCSKEGFEGIRSQDILPLLIEMFHFETFIPFGNLTDPFVARTFGPNFDARLDWDRNFIDEVEIRNEEEMAKGTIKPTQILAILGKDAGSKVPHSITPLPSFYVRDPLALPPVSATADSTNPHLWARSPHGLEFELESTCRWLADAERLASELFVLRGLHLDLQKEFEERTAWALKLDGDFRGLHEELERRTEWALGLDREIEQLTAKLEELGQIRRAEYETNAGVREPTLGERIRQLQGKLRRIFGGLNRLS